MTTLYWTVQTKSEHETVATLLIRAGWALVSSQSRPGTTVWQKGRTVYEVEVNALRLP